LVFYVFPGYYDSDDIPGIGQYEDFHTIDWQRDIARDRMRHRYIVKKRQVGFETNAGFPLPINNIFTNIAYSL
jgi:hypothetical protein